MQGAAARVRVWLRRQDRTRWLLFAIALLSLVPRLYGLNWDANNHLHPDERQIVFVSMCLSLPGTPRAAPPTCPLAYTGPGWLLSPSSPLNPGFFAYGSLPMYLLAIVAHGLAWLTTNTHLFAPPDGGAWDDFNHFTLIGRALSALFDAGSVLLAGLIARRLAGRKTALLAAALVATIPFDVQVAHFYAVDTQMLFFVLLTLLGCVMLVQVPARRMAERDGVSVGSEVRRSSFWRTWGAGLFTGAAFGLAIGCKVSALPLLAPMAVAIVLRWRRRGFDDALLVALGVGAAAVLAFSLTNPYALIDWNTFTAQVQEQNALSRGQRDYPYVRQFADMTPFVYQIQQLLLFDMGLPLGLLGLAGFGWAVSRVWRRLGDDWLVLVVWVAAYFAVVGSAYMKFSRYMLPVFVPLAICGAAMLAALARWGTERLRTAEPAAERSGEPGGVWARWSARLLSTRPALAASRLWGAAWWRFGCVALGVAMLGASTFATLALVNIYSTPNTRVQASEWIYDHVPAGASITNEVWDDPLPIFVPAARAGTGGVGLTRAGHAIVPYQYNEIGLDLYADDTQAKAATLASQLASANVVVISSQRLLRSIPKLPDRYPMTTRYYQLLFAGKLGFTLAAHFENPPHLLGFTLNESGADESFSVYDHPPVWIFVRTGAGLSQPQLLAALTNGVHLPAMTTRAGAQKSLLLPPAVAAADTQAQPLGVQFPATSLPNSIPLVWWLLIVELLGLGCFPLAYVAFRGLYDRGWGLSKLLGMLLLAWLTWLPASLRILPFDHWVVVGAFAALMAAGAAVGWWRRGELRAFGRERWRVLVICEAAFLVAFLFFTWIRALDPDLWHIYRGGEKPMELAFIDAILRSRYLPPLDPWFSGGYINYYYYGQYIFAALIKLTGIAPTTAFSLAIPLLFGVTFTAAFSVVAGLTRRWWAGLAAGVGLVVLGNLDGLGQLIGQWQAVILSHQPPPLFDYWASSRVIPFTINEFPYWSFLYADLHAHLIDLPIVVFIIAACASLLAGAREEGRRWWFVVPTLAAIALALGAAWCTNTWDVPTYGLLVAVVLALRLLPFGEPEGWTRLRELATWRMLRGYLAALVLTLGASYALYFPFHAGFQSVVTGTGTVSTPTDPRLFATVFGLWLFLVASFFAVELWDRIEQRIILQTPESIARAPQRLWIFVAVVVVVLTLAFMAGTKALLVVLLAAGIVLALDSRHSPARLMTYMMLLLGLGVALGVELIYVRDFLDNSPWERMNTVFKFYYQVWTLFALGGALAFTQLICRVWIGAADDGSDDTPIAQGGTVGIPEAVMEGPVDIGQWTLESGGGVGLLRGAWIVALLLLVLGSSVFLVEGTQVRLQDPQIWADVQPPPGGIQPTGPSLDGMAYMRGWYPGDYAAITWMNEHIGGDPTIVEASNGNYQWYGRVSIYTGLPDVLGWGSREYEQRYGEEVFPRQDDVQQFWGTEDPNIALAFLRQYNVKYIYFGTLERTCYVTHGNNQCVPMSAAAVAKFSTLAQAGVIRSVYDNAGVVIYEVTG